MKIEFTQLQRYEGLWGAWHELTVAMATWSRSIQEQSTFLKKVQLEQRGFQKTNKQRRNMRWKRDVLEHV